MVDDDRPGIDHPADGGGPATDRWRDRARLLAVLLAGVLGPGLARWWLGTLGYDRVGVAVFVGGYALALALVWRHWLSEVEFVGPDG